MSARMPFTVGLMLTLPQKLFHARQALIAVLFGETQALLPNLLLTVLARAAVLIIHFRLMLTVIALRNVNLLRAERGKPAHDLIVRAAFLEIRHQVQHSDAARRKLRPPATVDDFDGHGVGLVSHYTTSPAAAHLSHGKEKARTRRAGFAG